MSALPKAQPERAPIGQIFVERGLITEADLERALARQQETGARLGEVLVELGLIDRLALAGALGDHWSSVRARDAAAPATTEARLVKAESERDESRATARRLRQEMAGAIEQLRQSAAAAIALADRLDSATR